VIHPVTVGLEDMVDDVDANALFQSQLASCEVRHDGGEGVYITWKYRQI
jgi:hypothetical protein